MNNKKRGRNYTSDFGGSKIMKTSQAYGGYKPLKFPLQYILIKSNYIRVSFTNNIYIQIQHNYIFNIIFRTHCTIILSV